MVGAHLYRVGVSESAQQVVFFPLVQRAAVEVRADEGDVGLNIHPQIIKKALDTKGQTNRDHDRSYSAYPCDEIVRVNLAVLAQ